MTKIIIFGCGALGSQMAFHLAREGRSFVFVDDDVVEAGNIQSATTMYATYQVGARKAVALAEMIYRLRRCDVRAEAKTVDARNVAKLAEGCNVIVDAFDNTAARRLVNGLGGNVLHAGVGDTISGYVAWGTNYPLPSVDRPRGQNPVCTRDLGARILRMTAVVAADTVDEFIASGERREWLVGLDKNVRIR